MRLMKIVMQMMSCYVFKRGKTKKTYQKSMKKMMSMNLPTRLTKIDLHIDNSDNANPSKKRNIPSL